MDARPEAGGEQRRQIVVADRVENTKLHVGKRTHRQRNPFPHEPRNQRPVLQASHAMIDPLGAEGVEGRRDRGGRPLLSRMGHGVQAG